MGETSVLLATTTTNAITTTAAGGELAEAEMAVTGSHESNSGDQDGKRYFGGNRWPRHETLALLKIRSDMDTTFRDSSLKGPLWNEVSRKLEELGHKRSAKKCKEKFENVYKYHKRTKESRSGKVEGKNYKFFDQLEPLLTTQHSLPTKPQPNFSHHIITKNPITNMNSLPIVQPNSTYNFVNKNNNIISKKLFSTSTSSTASDEEFKQRHNKKKRKWKNFFISLTKEVIEKQEDLQKKFLEAIDKCENERIVKEEAWRIQEMARIDKEHEILLQGKSNFAAKDCAFIAFLQSASFEKQNPIVQIHKKDQIQVINQYLPSNNSLEAPKLDNNNNSVIISSSSSSSRWPKDEIEALIKLKSELDTKYEDNELTKGPLWEEISSGMRKLGYNRSSRRCKEKWENINKYFKKVKDSSKKRSYDSKTCPYFYQLDALYSNKKNKLGSNEKGKMDNHEPLMAQPENGDKEIEYESTEEDGFVVVKSKLQSSTKAVIAS